MRRCLTSAGLIIAWLSSSQAGAEWRCDCTTIINSCTAEVTVQDTFVEVSAPAAQCARVDYFIDGLPFVTVAVDGNAREDWIARSADPRILVQSCQVCVDNAAAPGSGTADATTPATGSATAELTPIVAPEPTWPRDAQLRGIEGTVTVAFTVNPFGDTQDVRVVSSQPAGVFDMAAVSAVSRWRYPSDGDRAPASLTETLDFSIDDIVFSGGVSAPAPNANEASLSAGNQCIRENVSFNYGEMVEVGLISACAEPMTLFACAAGTGANAARWVCNSTDQNSTVLVRPGDSRQGSLTSRATDNVQRDFRYAENFFVARAPNTEYWWIACAVSDTRCNSGARQWASAVNRQATQMDPQLLSRQPVARSY